MRGSDVEGVLVDALVEVADDLDLDATLRRAVAAARALTGARYGALGVLDEDGEALAQFIHQGIDEETADAIGDLPTGRGMLGELIRHPRPLRLDDVTEHPSSVPLPAAHPPIEAFLGVPVRVGEEVFGNLYLTGKSDGFDEDDERILVALATVAGSAIRNAGAAARLAAEELLQRALADLATAVLAGASRAELLTTVEVAGAGLLPGATATVITGDPVPAAAVSNRWTFPVDDDGATLVVDTDGASPWRATTDAREALATLSRQAGVALGWADARAEVRRLAVVGERDRIARDLHDTVIQRLFGAGLQLDSLTRRGDAAVADAAERVIAEIDAAIAELRSTIGRLDAPVPQDLRDRAEAVVGALAPACPGLVGLHLTGDLDDVPHAIAEDVPAVLREGIANAARHARASRIEPHVTVADDHVEVRVTDDGVGPPAGSDDDPTGRSTSLGLRNLTARAHRHGGSCRLEPVSPGGSRLVWRVPRD